MNRIPESLERPFLREAFVEFRYHSSVAVRLLPGLLAERLRALAYVLPQRPRFTSFDLGGLTVNRDDTPILQKDGYRLQFQDGIIHFSAPAEYPGWTAYRALIQETMTALLKPGDLSLEKVSLRYINDLQEVDIFALGGYLQSPTFSGHELTGQGVRLQLAREKTVTLLNLTSGVQLPHQTDTSTTVSVIDVDVQRAFKTPPTLSQVFDCLDKLHTFNKELVFGKLLPEAYVARFNPVYAQSRSL